jgi:putative membrane protein
MIDWRHWHNEPYLVGGLVFLGWLRRWQPDLSVPASSPASAKPRPYPTLGFRVATPIFSTPRS